MRPDADQHVRGRPDVGGQRSEQPRSRRLAVGAYLVVGMISLVLGVTYVTSSTFLPYHGDAIGTAWGGLDAGTQVVLRALVHVGGAGWLACGAALLVGMAASILERRGE